MKFRLLILLIMAVIVTSCTKYEQEEFVPLASQYVRVNKGVEIKVELNGNITLDARQEGITSYKWQGDALIQSNLDSPVVYVQDTGTCVVSYNKGQYTSTVIIVPAPIFYVPNSFSPDGRGPDQNNWWCPVFEGIISFDLKVFSTDHILLFESTFNEPYENWGWDGTYKETDCPAGYYYYYLTYTSCIGKEYFKTGYIQLLR